MLRFILRRLVQTIPMLLGITLISFAIMYLAPGDVLTAMESNPQVPPETVQRLREEFGLDKPWYVQYGLRLRSAVTGNFGHSMTHKIPVCELTGHYTRATLLRSVSALIFSWVVAI